MGIREVVPLGPVLLQALLGQEDSIVPYGENIVPVSKSCLQGQPSPGYQVD